MVHGGSILVSSEVCHTAVITKIDTNVDHPLSCCHIQYLKHLVELGNTKMQENLQRIEK